METTLTRLAAQAAADILGIETDLDAVTRAEAVAAYRKMLRATHPDTALDPAAMRDKAASQIRALQAAQYTLIDWVAQRPNPGCHLCAGSGFVRGASFSSYPCPNCK